MKVNCFRQLSLFLFFLLIANCPLTPNTQAEDGIPAPSTTSATAAPPAPTPVTSSTPPNPTSFRADTLGFYPLWETPGSILQHRALFVGLQGAAFGIKNRMQIGTTPLLFMYRVPNINSKFSLFNNEHLALALEGGVTYLLPMASRSAFSPMYTSRLDNPDFSVTLVPVAAGSTLFISDWLQIHQSVTALTVLGHGKLKNETTFGYSLVTEMTAKERHSALFHFGKVSFLKPELVYLGPSYRYQNSWMEFRLGYFYRFRSTGVQTAPLLDFGLILS